MTKEADAGNSRTVMSRAPGKDLWANYRDKPESAHDERVTDPRLKQNDGLAGNMAAQKLPGTAPSERWS